jgi:hypothetical protein
MMRRMPSVFAGAFVGSAPRAAGLRNFISSAVAVRGPHHGDGGCDAAVHPTSLDRRLDDH